MVKRPKRGEPASVGPFVAWRSGRPRFVPGPRERELGYTGEDLRHGPAGPWFSMDEARAFALARLEEIRERRAGALRAAPLPPPAPTVERLLADYMAAVPESGNAPATIAKKRELFRYIVEEKVARGIPLAKARVSVVEAADVKGFFEKHRRERGLSQARNMVMLLSAAWKWGRLDTRWRLKGDNPCHRLGMPASEPRVFVWLWEAIRLMAETADAMDLPFIGDAIYLGVFSGQRQADRLKMTAADLEQELMFFRTNKTGAVIELPQVAALERRLAAARERRAALPFRVVSANVVIDETTGRAMDRWRYHRLFNDVKEAAIARAKAAGDAHLAEHLAQARDQDLRDTIVTWLAREGASIIQIKGVTGHSLQSIMTTIRHYVSIDRTMGREAMAMLERWMEREQVEL